MKLNPKQQRFCEEYLIDLNAKQAAIRAGYSKKTAPEQGSRLLTNVNVKKYISEQMEIAKKNHGVTLEEVIAVVKEVMIEGMKDGDRMKAADMLMRHLGAYSSTDGDKTSVTVVHYE